MSTSHTIFRRLLRRGALALAVSAICAPTGSALAASTNHLHYPGTGEAPATSTPYVGTHYPVAPQSPVVVSEPVSAPSHGASGFDWTSAAIGAAGAGLLVIVSLGAAPAASRIRMRTVRS